MAKSFPLIVVCLFLTVPASAQRTFSTDILSETFGFDKSTKKSVALEDLKQGCEYRDCIPSIDNPKFVAIEDANHVADDDLVLAISLSGYKRAYPVRILDQHEIVNDIVAGIPLAITWCPLCGSAVAVHREIDGVMTEFGVSGVLYNSDLVFYDRKTETLWDQIEAKGIVGPLTGQTLQMKSVTMTRWGRWKAAHPDTLVLSDDTGFPYDYSKDAYARYRSSEQLMFPVSRNDDSVRPKTVVFGFDVMGNKVAIAESRLSEHEPVEWNNNGEKMLVDLAEDGSVWMSNSIGDEVYSPVRLFWFAWYAFHPETELIQ
ncbi:MAG: DUF3179 domain-containing protein [Gammaproteobacteria bacterium]|nr:DUF3179 domain-containing protein [Gammaproteobacteria bacterium]